MLVLRFQFHRGSQGSIRSFVFHVTNDQDPQRLTYAYTESITINKTTSSYKETHTRGPGGFDNGCIFVSWRTKFVFGVVGAGATALGMIASNGKHPTIYSQLKVLFSPRGMCVYC